MLHARGLRYRVQVPLLERPRRTADIVFPKKRIAIFVDGCFWHGCPKHGTSAKSNAEFWHDKIAANKKRDRDTNERLEGAGWTVVRVWEHEKPADVVDRIEGLVRPCSGGRGR